MKKQEMYRILKYLKNNYKSLVLNTLSLALILNLLSACKPKDENIDINSDVTISSYDKDEIIAFYKKHGVNVKTLSNGMCYVTDYETKEEKVVYAYSNDDFRQYLDVPYPTLSDVKNAIINNTNIDDEYKKALIKYVSNLCIYNDVDMSILYYNVKTLKGFVEVDLKDMQSISKSGSVVAFFRPSEHVVYFPNDYDGNTEDLLGHENTHFLTEAYFEDGNLKVIRTNTLNVPEFKMEENNIYINNFGNSFVEGSIDLTLMESNMLKGVMVGSYEVLSDVINLFLTYSTENIKNFNEKGPVNFYEKMYSIGLTDIYEIVSLMDELVVKLKNGEDPKNYNIMYYKFLKNVVEEMLKRGSSKKEIYETVIILIENGFILKQINFNNKEFVKKYGEEQSVMRDDYICYVDQILEENNFNGFKNLDYDTVLKILMGEYIFVTNKVDGVKSYRLIYKVKDHFGKFRYYSYETLEELNVEEVFGDYINTLGMEFYDEFGFFIVKKYQEYSEENILKLH